MSCYNTNKSFYCKDHQNGKSNDSKMTEEHDKIAGQPTFNKNITVACNNKVITTMVIRPLNDPT